MEAVMKKYLDPKTDLTFKKVFGEHKDLVISFMNALLPFDSPEEEIEDVEYLSPELVPVNPLWKDSVVDESGAGTGQSSVERQCGGCPLPGCPGPSVYRGDADDVDCRV